MRMEPDGMGGSACAKQVEVRARTNRASVIHQARGERSEIVIAGLQKEPTARGPMGLCERARNLQRCKGSGREGKNQRAGAVFGRYFFGTGDGARSIATRKETPDRVELSTP